MKVVSQIDDRASQDADAARPSIKVCMHVLGSARKDSRVMREATALVERGFAVTIVDIEGPCNQPVEEVIEGVFVKHVIVTDSFIQTRFTRWSLLRMVQLLMSAIPLLMKAPADVYHAHDVTGLPACYIAALVRRKLLIYDAHELPLAEISWHRLPFVLSFLLTCMISRCTEVITVTPSIAQEIRKRHRASSVSVVRNIPAYRVVPRSDLLRCHLGLSPGTRVALYQGYLQANRGLDNLVRAVPFMDQDIVIVLMGTGVRGTQDKLESLAEAEGVADRVRIIPYPPYAELLTWTASADVGILVNPPSYSLNVKLCLPNKFFEYLIAGLPTLASPIEAVSEIIKTYGVGRVVPSLLPTDIAATMNAMLNDRVALARMSRNAVEAAQNEFQWQKEQQRLFEVYEGLLIKLGQRLLQ